MSSFIEINIMCIILLILILSQSLFENNKRKSLKLFNCLASSMLLAISSDFIFYLQQGYKYHGNVAVSYLSNSLYFVGMLLGAYYGLRYIMAIILGIDTIPQRLNVLMLTPLIIVFMVVLTNNFHHLIFTIDTLNNYKRGPLLEACALLVFGYLLIAFGICLYNYYYALLKEQKTTDCKIMFYLFLPIIGGFVQYKFYGVNTTVPSVILTLLMIYINNLKNEVNYDGLTQLYNRRQFDKYSLAKFQQGKNNAYLVILDVDKFKEINDVKGHVEGDNALVNVANNLIKIFESDKAFIARYGGDEFAVIIECDSEHLLLLLNQLQRLLSAELSISISYGYCRIDNKQYPDISQIIKLADTHMYQYKNSKKRTID